MTKLKKKTQHICLCDEVINKGWKLANQDNRSLSNEIETLILNEAERRGVK